MPTPEELKDALVQKSRDAQDVRSKGTFPMPDSKTPDIDEEALSRYLVNSLKNDESDKVGSNWSVKREYDLMSYFQVKDKFMSTWPWPNASDFIVPLIPVLLDVGHTAINSSVDIPKNMKVRGWGIEDRRVAPHREKILQAQFRDQIDTDQFLDASIFETLLHGTTFGKVTRRIPTSRFGINLRLPHIENIYLPLDAEGPEVGNTDHIHEIIPMTMQDILIRAQLKDAKGKPFFKNMDQIAPGWQIGMGDGQRIMDLKDSIYGTDMMGRISRDIFYWAETHITWWHAAGARPVELKVWWVPSTGAILRYVLNEDGVRPYFDMYLYEHTGRIFRRSLPEILRQLQEKANYTDKQLTDAADIALSPSMFVPEGSSFVPGRNQRVPTGVYSIKPGTQPYFEQPNISPLRERALERESIWNMAGNLSGFTEPLQGVLPSHSVTATTDTLRTQASRSRLQNVLKRYSRGIRKMLRLVDHATERYMPRNTAVKLLGVTELQSIEEVYPNNNENSKMIPNFSLDYYVEVLTPEEAEARKQDRITVMQGGINHPIFGADEGNAYRAFNEVAKAMNVDDFEDIFHAPASAKILSPDQMINRVMSGQLDVQPSPEIDPVPYQTAIQSFQLTASFKSATPEQLESFQKLLLKLEVIRMLRQIAIRDFQLTQSALAPQEPEEGQPAQKEVAPNAPTV